MFSSWPDCSCCEINGGEKITGGLVITGCNGSKLLELAKEILKKVSCLVQMLVNKTAGSCEGVSAV